MSSIEGVWAKNDTFVLVYYWKGEWRLNSVLKSGRAGKGGIGFPTQQQILDYLNGRNYVKMYEED